MTTPTFVFARDVAILSAVAVLAFCLGVAETLLVLWLLGAL